MPRQTTPAHSTPEAIVSRFLHALERQDHDKVAALLAPGLEHVLAAHERHARAWQEAGAPSEGETS